MSDKPNAPREPTEAMLTAARDWSKARIGAPIGNDAARSCWQVMFDASDAIPTAPAPEGEAAGARHMAEGTRWRHLKTGHLVTIVGSCRLESTNEPAYLYNHDGVIWARSMDQFLDGRFEKIAAPAPTTPEPPVWRHDFKTTFHVIAYDESGYGDNRSRDFTDEAESLAYARNLEPRFHAIVSKTISSTMQPISVKIYPPLDAARGRS